MIDEASPDAAQGTETGDGAMLLAVFANAR